MSKFDKFYTGSLLTIAVGLGVTLYKLCRIQLEVEHIASNAKRWDGGPVRTRKQEREYYDRIINEDF